MANRGKRPPCEGGPSVPVCPVCKLGPGHECPRRRAKEHEELLALRAFASAHEQWEADLILDGEAWHTEGGLPRFTQGLWDQALSVQALRNRAKALGQPGEPPGAAGAGGEDR